MYICVYSTYVHTHTHTPILTKFLNTKFQFREKFQFHLLSISLSMLWRGCCYKALKACRFSNMLLRPFLCLPPSPLCCPRWPSTQQILSLQPPARLGVTGRCHCVQPSKRHSLQPFTWFDSHTPPHTHTFFSAYFNSPTTDTIKIVFAPTQPNYSFFPSSRHALNTDPSRTSWKTPP